VVHAVHRQLAGRQSQFCCQFHTGGTRADDADIQGMLSPLQRLVILAQKGVEHQVVEAPGLFEAVQEQAVVLGAGRAKVVGGAAHGNHQCVVGDMAFGNDLCTVDIVERGYDHFLAIAVQSAHAAELEFVMVFAGMGAVVDLVRAGIQGTGGNFVQQGFPDVGQTGIHQRDSGFSLFTQFVAEAGNKFETAGATADHNNVMKVIHTNQTCK